MNDYYNKQILKESDVIIENIKAIRSVQQGEFSEILQLLSLGWNGEIADSFMKKSKNIYESLDGITGGLEIVAEQLAEAIV